MLLRQCKGPCLPCTSEVISWCWVTPVMNDGLTLMITFGHFHVAESSEQVKMVDLDGKGDGFTVVCQQPLDHGMTENLTLQLREFGGGMFELLFAVFEDGGIDTIGGRVFVITVDVVLVLPGTVTAWITTEPCAIGSADTVVEIVPRVGVGPGHGGSVHLGV